MRVMIKLFSYPVVWGTLALNLLLGNVVLRKLFEGFTPLNISCSVVAVFSLLVGFRYLSACSRVWTPILLGVACSFAVPAMGTALWACLRSVASGHAAEAVSGIFGGVYLGLAYGYPFTLPFVVGNAIAFVLYRRTLRRESDLCAANGGAKAQAH